MKKFIKMIAVISTVVLFFGCSNPAAGSDDSSGSRSSSNSDSKKITITLDTDGGTMNKTSYTLEPSKDLDFGETPVKEGLFFNGWYDAEGNKVEKAPETDITLKAKWGTELTTLGLWNHISIFELYPEATVVIHVEKPATDEVLNSLTDDNITLYARWIEKGAFDIFMDDPTDRFKNEIKLTDFTDYSPKRFNRAKFTVKGRQFAGYVEAKTENSFNAYIYGSSEDGGTNVSDLLIKNIIQDEITGDFTIEFEFGRFLDDFDKYQTFEFELWFDEEFTKGYPILPVTITYNGKL